jgi:hypothetical protein
VLAAKSGNGREVFGIPSRETAAQCEVRLMGGQCRPGRVIENAQAAPAIRISEIRFMRGSMAGLDTLINGQKYSRVCRSK